MSKDDTKKKVKVLKHVKIYDILYNQIQEGIFPCGSKLPSEPDLALQMGVSRMTLRHALALLQEDGLVKNIHGKGNFVQLENELETNKKLPGLETIQHPVYHCCTEAAECAELEFRLEPPSDFITKNIGFKTAAVVIADRWYKNNEQVVAYSLSFIPIETISNEHIDLNNLERLKRFLEHDIYTLAKHSTIKCSYSTTGNFTSQKYTLSKDNSFTMIHESMYDQNDKILVVNKHYIPNQLCQLNIQATRANV